MADRSIPRRAVTAVTALIAFAALVQAPFAIGQEPADDAAHQTLRLRTRTEQAPGSNRYHTVTKQGKWLAKETAVVICDMWD